MKIKKKLVFFFFLRPIVVIVYHWGCEKEHVFKITALSLIILLQRIKKVFQKLRGNDELIDKTLHLPGRNGVRIEGY